MNNSDELMVYSLLKEYEKLFIKKLESLQQDDENKMRIIPSLEKLRELIVILFKDLLDNLNKNFSCKKGYVTVNFKNQAEMDEFKYSLKKDFDYEDKDFKIDQRDIVNNIIPYTLKFKIFKEYDLKNDFLDEIIDAKMNKRYHDIKSDEIINTNIKNEESSGFNLLDDDDSNRFNLLNDDEDSRYTLLGDYEPRFNLENIFLSDEIQYEKESDYENINTPSKEEDEKIEDDEDIFT